jgi:hypothetical protein
MIFKIFWVSIVSFIAALCVEISPHERLLTPAQHSIKMLSSLEQALGSPMYRGWKKYQTTRQKCKQKEKFRGKIVTTRKNVTCSVGMS